MGTVDARCVPPVLARFGMESPTIQALGNHGGFSGASLWRVAVANGEWCLKAWPADVSLENLRHAHWLMRQARAEGLDYVPSPHESASGGCESADGRFWDLTTWQPGVADFHARPSVFRLEAACEALARLHAAWRPAKPQVAPIPAVRRRLAATEHWLSLVRTGWTPDFGRCTDPALASWAERAWLVLGYTVRRVPGWLAGWIDARLPVQPCLCDLWHDHVLFTDDALTGLIDFGSVKTDHPAVDLARLLGSLVEDDAALREAGFDAYDRIGGLSRDERALADALDRTGTVLGLSNWMRWIFADERTFPEPERIANRLAGLVRRIEDW